jgi:ketosteroid isomerase-like protein
MGETEALLTRLYEAFNRKDIEAVVGSLHPEIDWPNVFGEGRVRGLPALRQMWADWFSKIDPEATPISFTVRPDGRVTVLVNYVVRTLDGKIFTDELASNTYRFKDGLIIGMDWD